MRLRSSGIVAAVLCAPLVVHAQSSDADILLRRAAELREAGQYEDALRLATQAIEREGGARALGELAANELALERWVAAERHLEELLALDDPWVSRRRLTLEATLGDVRTHLARVAFARGPAGATVEINGSPVGTLPIGEPVRVASGRVQIVVRAEGYPEYRRDVQVYAGATHFEEVLMESLRPASRAPSPATTCGPGLILRGGLCYSATPPDTGGLRPSAVALWGGVAVAGVAALTAIGLGADGDRIAGAYTERCGTAYRADCASEFAAAQDTLSGRATAVNALIAVTVIGAGAAVVGAVLELRARRHRAPVAVLRAHPAGIEVRW